MSLTAALADLISAGQDNGTRLLATAYEQEGTNMSLAELARWAGVPKASGARWAERMLEDGFLLEEARTGRERLVRLNPDHPLYEVVADLVWVQQGVSGARDPYRLRPGVHPAPALSIHDHRVQQLVPVELQTRGLTADLVRRDAFDGPDLARARTHVLRLERMLGRVWFEPTLQSTYGRWHDERDRDLIHLTLHLGQGTSQAARALRAMCTAREAAHDRVGRTTWAHATFAVNADAVLCRTTAERLFEAVDVGRRLSAAAQELDAVQRRVSRPSVLDETGLPGLAERDHAVLTAAQEELESATAAVQPGRHYLHGGTPPMTSIGQAGERLLAVQVQALSVELCGVVRDMSAEPSFQAWLEAHPEAASGHPLLVE